MTNHNAGAPGTCVGIELDDTLVEGPARLGSPAGAFNNIAEAFAFAEQLGLQPVRATAHGDGRFGKQVASPINLSGAPVSYRTRRHRWVSTALKSATGG
jgi:hypothetical protein